MSVLAPVGKGGLTVDFGKFVTPIGAEVIESKDNFNYSRGLLFALAIPYYHMGARVGYSFSDKVSLTGYLVNGWNDVKDNNGAKTVGASLAIKPGKATIIANYLVGDEQPEGSDGGTRNLIDLVATLPLGEKSSFSDQLRLRPRQGRGGRRRLVGHRARPEVSAERQVRPVAALRVLRRQRRLRHRHRPEPAGVHADRRSQDAVRASGAVRVPRRLLRQALLRQGQRFALEDAADGDLRADLRVLEQVTSSAWCGR